MSSISLGEVFKNYTDECEYVSKLRPETIRGYKNVFRLFLKIMPEVTSIELLTPGMLNEFFKRINTRPRIVGSGEIRTGVKPSTIKTHYNKLNAFFEWLLRKKHIEENPLKDIKRPKVDYEDFRRVEDADLRKIYTAIALDSNCNAFIQRRDTAMVSILLFTGVRLGEFISLRVTDIDLGKREIIVRGETSKSKKTRTLKIHPTLAMHFGDYFRERKIRQLKTEHLLVSSREDKGLTRDGLKNWVKGIIKKSGVKFHLHQLRHTFACKLAEQDVNLSKIQKMMGHVDVRMTTKYTRSLRTEDMEDDIGKISI